MEKKDALSAKEALAKAMEYLDLSMEKLDDAGEGGMALCDMDEAGMILSNVYNCM